MVASAKRNLDIVVAAKDDTAAGISSASQRLREFRRKMADQQSQEKETGKAGSLMNSVGKLAAVAVAVDSLATVARSADGELQKFFSHTQGGMQTFVNVWTDSWSNNRIVGPVVSALKEIEKPFGRLVANVTGNKETLLNGFSFEEETKSITELSDAAARATMDLHSLTVAVGQKGLEKSFAEIDAAIEGRIAEMRAKLEEVAANGSEAEKAAANQKLDRLNEEADALKEKAKAEAQKQSDRDELDRERNHTNDLRQLAAEQNAALLTEGGRQSDAQIELINQKYDRMESEEKARVEQMARDIPEHEADLRARSDEKLKGLAERRQHEIDQAKREDARGDLQQEYNRLRDLGDIQAATTAQRLRSQRREADALLVELTRNHEKEMQEIDRQAQEKTEKLSQVDDEESQRKIAKAQSDAAQQKAALETKFGQDREVLTQQAALDQANKRDTVEHNIAQLRINQLKEEGELGNANKALEAERLSKLEKYAEEKRDILRMLREEKDLSDADRKQLEDSLKSIDANQEKVKAGLTSGVNNTFTRASLPEAQGPGLTGLAQAAREEILNSQYRQMQAQLETAKQAAASAKETSRIREILESLLRGTNTIIPVT